MLVKLFLICLALVACISAPVNGQAPIPARPDGFPLGGYGAPVVLDIFVDLLCPDSAAVFPTFLQVIAYYKGQVQSLLHFFPLPYHTASFFASQGAHVVAHYTKNNMTAVYSYASQMFDAQEQWFNGATFNMTSAQVQASMATWVGSTGIISEQDFLDGLADQDINEDQRVQWKYACSRGILGTPMFLINGVALVADSSWSLSDWQNVINPLLHSSTQSHRFEPAPVSDVLFVQESNSLVSPNNTCPAGETLCNYLPGKFDCCKPGHRCVRNVGCRCFDGAALCSV